jgi:hypothetical protein
MKIGPNSTRQTSISTATPDQIVIRGKDLCTDLIGKVSFTQHTWLLVTGSMPSDAQTRALDAALVAIAEHGLVPSVQAARITYAGRDSWLRVGNFGSRRSGRRILAAMYRCGRRPSVGHRKGRVGPA